MSDKNRSSPGRNLRKALITGTCVALLIIIAISAAAFRQILVRPEPSPDSKALFAYVKSGDLKSIEKALDSHQEMITARDGDGLSLVHIAVEGSASPEEALKLLIAHRADISSRSANEGETPLHIAAEKGNTACAKLLIDNGASVDAKDAILGQTPLHRACIYNHPETATLLLDNNAYINAADDASGDTPLHKASLKGYAEMVRLLVSRGADISRDNREGQTAMDSAAMFGKEEEVNILKSIDRTAAPYSDHPARNGQIKHTGVE